jgi:hypothetical protein
MSYKALARSLTRAELASRVAYNLRLFAALQHSGSISSSGSKHYFIASGIFVDVYVTTLPLHA